MSARASTAAEFPFDRSGIVLAEGGGGGGTLDLGCVGRRARLQKSFLASFLRQSRRRSMHDAVLSVRSEFRLNEQGDESG